MELRTLDLLAITGDTNVERVLHTILKRAREAAQARYGALGVPDGRGGFARFITVGVSDRRAALIGDLPRVHGVLGALLDGGAIRLADIRRHPQFGYYPSHHPILKDFLGVSIEHRGEVLGNLFLAGSRRGRFSAQDQRAVQALATYAGVAIANARLYRQAQELARGEERGRVARELHDSVSQMLFSMVYEARAAGLRAEDQELKEALASLESSAAAALQEMRALVYALRPKSLERDGLEPTLRDLLEALRRAHGAAIEVRVSGEPSLSPAREKAILRIAQEALHNSLRHAPGARIHVSLEDCPADVRLSVNDDGPGFKPAALPHTSLSMGLETMRERAESVGAHLAVESRPGGGCSVSLRVPKRG